ncbi:MAG TPA: hypothetical protein DIV86_03770 [Alphaproteobacteria bacterium]|nr:hypothetical protein [Alphaproteobacteria bacterium]
MPRPQLNSAMTGKILIYSFLAVIFFMFIKIHSGDLKTQEKIRYLAYYIPALIATVMMFTAGVNFSLGVIIQKNWLILASVAQYCWLFYFEFMMRSAGGFTQIEQYKRAVYFIPVIFAQLVIDRFLRKGGSIETWFYKAKFIAGIALICACTWNYMAFEVYFKIK